MMKRVLLSSVLTLLLAGAAMANPYSQTIDFTSSNSTVNPYWSSSNGDSHTNGKYIEERNGTDFSFTHDLTSLIGASDTITSANLALYFVDTENDSSVVWWKNEDLNINFDNTSWQSLGEVDTGTKSFDVLARVADRVLSVALNFTSDYQDIYLKTSTLSGAYTPYQDPPVTPVPAAFLIGVLGLGTAGLKLRRFA
jgi:hypothetical protein